MHVHYSIVYNYSIVVVYSIVLCFATKIQFQRCGRLWLRLCFLPFLPLCFLLVQVDALLLHHHHQKLLNMIVLFHQLNLQFPYFSGELLCLNLHLLNGGMYMGGGGRR